MNLSFPTIAQELKKIRREDYFYVAILFVFFGILAFVFSVAASFLSLNIDKVFSSNKIDSVGVLDMDPYASVARKLNLTIPVIDQYGNIETPSAPQTSTTTSAELPFDKQSLVIKVLNATAQAGLAGKMKAALEQDGFMVVKTGNEEGSYEKTTLFIQKGKEAYEKALMEVIVRSYPDAIATTTDDNDGYDAIVIVGGE